VEIGLGLRYLALIHILGHGCLRTLQFVRAPSLLFDYRTLENAIGTRLPHLPGPWERLLPDECRAWFYRLALERGYLDACLSAFVVGPFLSFFRWCDAAERRWTDVLTGGPSRESERPRAAQSSLDDLI
jgi:NAD(P)H-quinone oxidoreductase subunit 5